MIPELSAGRPIKKSCACCSKKLTLTDFACGKCQIRYCAVHRLPEEHACSSMEAVRVAAQAALAAANPQVIGKKVDII
jgi:predicted nucleic acid binding AN1-type Zn finger protein